jgi:glyoxylase-like metal-dependent hydrolase (beta-lactamase superfamily II)
VTGDRFDPSAYANAVVIEGDDGLLLVDTRHGPSAGRDLAEAIRARTDTPVRWVVNTHWHGDHVWGNESILEAWPDATILGHPATLDRIVAEGSEQVDQERARLGARIGRIEGVLVSGRVPDAERDRYTDALARARGQLRDLEGFRPTPPGEAVPDRLTLDLGGREVVVFHPGRAHTDGDLVVWVPDLRFLAAGDLLEEAPLWLDGADVRGWSRALGILEALDPQRVLPSHGRLRPDAALLTAHAGFLGDAVDLSGPDAPADSAAWVRALASHREPLAAFGVEDAAFESYVAAVRTELQGDEEVGDGAERRVFGDAAGPEAGPQVRDEGAAPPRRRQRARGLLDEVRF